MRAPPAGSAGASAAAGYHLIDTPRVDAGFLKQNFKVKFESRNTKMIAWQHLQKIGRRYK